MTEAAERLLEEFEALPDEARSEVMAEMARRIAWSPHVLPGDDDLTASADSLFLEMDRAEQQDDAPAAR